MAIGTPTLIDHQSASAATIGLTVPVGGIASGSDVVVYFAQNTNVMPTGVSDTRGNTYTIDETSARATSLGCGIAHAHLGTGLQAGDKITVTWGAAHAVAAVGYSDSGLASASLDQVNAANNASASPSVATASPTTQASEIVFGIFAENTSTDTFTADTGAGYTKLQSQQCGATNVFLVAEYKIVAATGTQTADGTFGTSQSWAGVIATYKAAAAATFIPQILAFG